MSCKQNIQDMYQMIGEGKSLEALEKFYHDDVKVMEATGEVREGKAAQKAGIEQWYSMVKERHGGGVNSITADEDNQVTMVESWVDITMQNGHRMKMEEVGVQRWKDGKIISERFYYNAPNQ